jgi:hypothetical protein
VAVKNRASLLRTLTRFDRCSRRCRERIEGDSLWTLNCGDTEELAEALRQITRVQLDIMELSRELASVSRQIRALVLGTKRCLALPAPAKRNDYLMEPNEIPAMQRSAFAAVITENGALVVRVVKNESGMWPQREYGRFETWTQAQGFATMLNQRYGIDPVEAQHIVVSASLARSSKQNP